MSNIINFKITFLGNFLPPDTQQICTRTCAYLLFIRGYSSYAHVHVRIYYISGGKKCQFFKKSCLRTKWIILYLELSLFFFGPSSTLGNCPYKFVRCLESQYLELSLCQTIFLVPLAFLGLFSIHYLERFHFIHLNVERIHSKTQIECLSFLFSTTCHSRESLTQNVQARNTRLRKTQKVGYLTRKLLKNMVYLKTRFQLGLKTKRILLQWKNLRVKVFYKVLYFLSSIA